MDLSLFDNALDHIGHVRTHEGITFADPTMEPQPASPFRRLHMLEFAAATGFVPGSVYSDGKKAWKVVFLPSERMDTPNLVQLARKLLDIPMNVTDVQVIDDLLVGHNDIDGNFQWGPDPLGNAPIRRTTNNDQVKAQWLAEAIFTMSGATLSWCSPKGGAIAIWLYQGDGMVRAWGDIDPFIIEKVTEKLPKRLAAMNRDTVLHYYTPKVCVIPVEAVRRPDGSITHFVTTKEGDKIRYNEGDKVVAVWEAGEGDDGWGIIAKRFVHEMIAQDELAMRAVDPKAVDHMYKRSLWQIRGFISKEHGIDTMMKGDMAMTAMDAIVIRRRNGKRFLADMAVNTDGLKGEISIREGMFLILDKVTDKPGETARTNRHMMIVGHDWLLKSRIAHGLAMRNDELIANTAAGRFPTWMGLLAEGDHGDTIIEDNMTKTTVNIFQERIRNLVDAVEDITYSRKAMSDIRSQHMDRNKPKNARNGKVWRDTRHFPIPASDNYRSLKPLSVALLTGHLEHDFVLEDGEWINTKVGLITNNRTWFYMMQVLGGGDGDDHGTMIHGIAKGDPTIFNATGPDSLDLPVDDGDLISIVFRMPIGVSCNPNGEWGVEYFVLKPHVTERIGLATRFDFDDEIFEINMDKRPARIDEVVYPSKTDPITFQPQVQTYLHRVTSYTIPVFVWQLQGALEVAAMGGIGAMSNLDMFAFQHGMALPWFCHNETKVDLLTQAVPTTGDIQRMVNYIQGGIGMISVLPGSVVDAISLLRFEQSLGENHPLFKSANYSLMFGVLENVHNDLMIEFKNRFQSLLNQQTAAMLELLKDVVISGKPAIIQMLDQAKALLNKKYGYKLTVEQFNTMGRMVVIGLNNANVPEAQRVDDMIEALAYCYRNGPTMKFDQNLMNGDLLQLLGKALAKLRAQNGNAPLAEEVQTEIRCDAVANGHLTDHAMGCWIMRHEGPEGTRLFNEVGRQMSVRCYLEAQRNGTL